MSPVRLWKNGVEIDSAQFRHGVRTVELERTSITGPKGEGEFCFRVNGEKIFIKGSNHVPADAYHSRDVERIPRIIDLAVECGCNMLRCWGGNVYENDLFYDLCDEKGLLIWQDFGMGCAVYPQDEEFQRALAHEAGIVVRRLRGHACIALWAGDNECDLVPSWFGDTSYNPNTNLLTRVVLPRVLQAEDPKRAFLPSSPYMDEVAFRAGQTFLPEEHLWGPRDYFRSDYYKNSLCHFASEIGYHGCPSPDSIRKFISPENLWPNDNAEWLLHSTCAVPELGVGEGRITLMNNQIREMFGTVPDNLEDYAFASQCVQAEAKKFFIELFRTQKWRRTGILWWNLIDGWPQFSDAVVDYYFGKKLAFDYIKRASNRCCWRCANRKTGTRNW
jgi:beta-mannosidase